MAQQTTQQNYGGLEYLNAGMKVATGVGSMASGLGGMGGGSGLGLATTPGTHSAINGYVNMPTGVR
jgi:hypothetical protein